MKTTPIALLASLLLLPMLAYAQPGPARDFEFRQKPAVAPFVAGVYTLEECTADGVFVYVKSTERPDCQELAAGLIQSGGFLSIDFTVVPTLADLMDYALLTDLTPYALSADLATLSGDVTALNTALAGKADDMHGHSAADLTDASALGLDLLTAANAAAARTAIGAGTSSFDGTFAALTGTPTTLAGYGITDGFDGAYASLSGIPSTFAPDMDTQAHIADAATDAATNAPTALTGSALGDLETELNATNAMYNDLAAKYNALAAAFNTLLDAQEANGILSP